MSSGLIKPSQKRHLASSRTSSSTRASNSSFTSSKKHDRMMSWYRIWGAVLLVIPVITSLLLIRYHAFSSSSSVWTIRSSGVHTGRDRPPSHAAMVVQDVAAVPRTTRTTTTTVLDPTPTTPRTTTTHFEWKCWDKCSCLPPEPNSSNDNNTILYMHQSFKTDNQSQWPTGWSTFRQSWLDHHHSSSSSSSSEPRWVFVFWLDEHNDLLAKCTGYYEKLFHGRSSIQRADLSRLLYLYKYGGLYADLDYLALQSHVPLLSEHPVLKTMTILLQGRVDQDVGLEWGFARTPGHDFWTYCLNHRIGRNGRAAAAPFSTGPHMLRRCLKFYAYPSRMQRQSNASRLVHMHPYSSSLTMKATGSDRTGSTTTTCGAIIIVEPRLIAPLDGRDFESNCGQWRHNAAAADDRRSNIDTSISWQNGTSAWQSSACRKHLVDELGSYAVTFYSQSWME